MDTSSERRLIENELLFRDANLRVQQQIQEDRSGRGLTPGTKVHFYCECSNFRCRDRIILTAGEYQAAHQDNRHFIILPGHENRAVERVIQSSPVYSVVEKFIDPAKALKSA